MLWFNAIFLVIAYLIGSISSAIIICKVCQFPDPRKHGSGNPGATNVIRTGSKKAGLLVFVCDFLKGLVAVYLASFFGVTLIALSLVAATVVIGHIYPVFFQFKGGKGVATAFGAILALYWPLALIMALVWLICLLLTRYVSLASVATAASSVIFCLVLHPFPYEFGVLIIAGLIAFRHKDNLVRLLEGKESKIKLRKQS